MTKKNTKIKPGPPRIEKKGVVIYAGFPKGGGSIRKVQKQLGCKTVRNVIMHIDQCRDYGFETDRDGDWFKIDGEIPSHWALWGWQLLKSERQ